ncbi:orotate phosphoribosyltransferase [Parasphaerochaeta coccoides]|uniref:Orotate phosphoribosyltransferase n=1 Tax=Parasphaerochaeta coccoides (strain ATCC BAA-1237 / DSM 17374 / SPN1) TaxID=760011 RepID=F4GJI5_PARC1|nr:orotate phosphoribosyltransferase [Parasphaerochaeta coccoides]AEC02250.1 orotate phosphoribosyltransferase [Parasphaerochaeta coccoides DSM 17374]
MRTLEDIQKHYGRELARRAMELEAVRLSPEEPFTWASGYRMPIYNDNRRFLAEASARAYICEAFAAAVETLGLHPRNIAGTATAGIPHATTLADKLGLPLSYVRSQGKDHGMKQQIEGLTRPTYEGVEVLLIEDLISTGGSSVAAVNAILAADGRCPVCLAIFSYGFPASQETFSQIRPVCTPYSLLEYDTLVDVAHEAGYVSEDGARILADWRIDPFGWGERHGFPKKG